MRPSAELAPCLAALLLVVATQTAFARTAVNRTLTLNLINPDWGWQCWGSFPQSTTIGHGGLDAATLRSVPGGRTTARVLFLPR